MDESAQSFQKELERISESVQNLNQSQLAEAQTAINQLSDRVRDAGADIPAHDRKVYGDRIKNLQQSLRDRQTAIAPKTKFSFASKSSGFAARNKEPVTNVSNSQPPKSAVLETPTPVESTSFTCADLNGARIDFDSEGERGSRPCNLSNLSSCIADMRDQRSKTTAFASLTAKDINNSIIVCDHVNGPVHVTSVRNSIIVVSAQQFRMHKSESCHVYLQTPSRPIIEDCSDIRFTALPDFFKTSKEDQTENQLTEVDDFNWHRTEPSPNWSFLNSTEIIESDRWQTILKDKNITVKDVFKSMKSDAAAATEKTVA